MAKPAKGAPKGQRPHLEWFDDSPPKRRAGRASSPAEKRAERARVRPLAGALPRPVRVRPNPPRPAKAAGLGGGVARSLVDRSRIRLPRRLVIPLPPKRPRQTLGSRRPSR